MNDYGPTLQVAKDEAMRLLHTGYGLDAQANAINHLAGAILLAAVVMASGGEQGPQEDNCG